MKLHEYQAKAIFREYGIPCPQDRMVTTPEEAVQAATEFGLPVVLKAQVHVGGRGKAGGVKLVSKMEEIEPTAQKILGLTIKGLPVNKLMVAPGINIATEVYLSILVDRGSRGVVFVGCAEGGVEIEETAKTNPELILKHFVRGNDLVTLKESDLAGFARKLFSDSDHAKQAAVVMVKMAKLFREKDASLVEINPLIVDGDGKVVALDAKMMVDDNALFRQPDIEAMRDMDSEDQDELDAKAKGLSFIRLEGNIGCMVNGAGLAMATMDTIKHFGGNPANFLDVGGSSDPKKVVAAFELILKDESVKAILVNIFGGITRCDDIARGLLQAMEMMEVKVPIVIRLVGTNEKEGRALLEGTDLITAESLEKGAIKAAEVAKA